MKHVKLYEQFNFDDFSDEELFGGPEKDLNLMATADDDGNNSYYVVKKSYKKDHYVILFDDESNVEIEDALFGNIDPPPPLENSKISVFVNSRGFDEYKWKDLPKEIKDRINI